VTLAFQQQNDLAYIRQVHGSLGRLSVHSQDTSLTGNISEEAALLSGESKLAAALDESEAKAVVARARKRLASTFETIDLQTQRNIKKILDAFKEAKVGSNMFAGVDGYGHGDIGRDTLDEVFAKIFGAEAALVRAQCFSGTHAIACALFGVLRPGDRLLSISGSPYDTLEEVIGTRKPATPNLGTALLFEDEEDYHYEDGLVGSLAEWGVSYGEVPLQSPPGGPARNGQELFDLPAIDAALEADPSIKVLAIQRSCGYSWRQSISVQEIERAIRHIKSKWSSRNLIVFVDNCYGELVEDREPTHVGADLVAGSLIKNLGGTIARSGGYVAGKKKYVQAAMNRLGAPGVAGGATLSQNRNLYQGLFLSPTVVGEALKGASLIAEVLGGELGCPCNPPSSSFRTDIIQAVQLGTRGNLIAFCGCVQRHSPVGAYISPTPGRTPGYGDEVIFADGTFMDGSTLELSADGPLRAPYTAFAQGGTHWTHWAIVLEAALQEMQFPSPSFAVQKIDVCQQHDGSADDENRFLSSIGGGSSSSPQQVKNDMDLFY